MAKKPSELLELTEADKDAVTALEDYIDVSPEFAAFQGGDVKVVIPEEMVTKHLTYRESLRRNALRDRYINAGWKFVTFTGTGNKITMVLNQTTPSYGSCGKD